MTEKGAQVTIGDLLLPDLPHVISLSVCKKSVRPAPPPPPDEVLYRERITGSQHAMQRI